MTNVTGAAWYPGREIVRDAAGRIDVYRSDWRDGWQAGIRIFAPSIYIFLASLLPALAFGLQLDHDTDGSLGVVQVLAATAISGLLQAIIGGQPLLIVGVAEPIVIIYSFMYRFADDQPSLGRARFLPWAAWVCVWAGLMVAGLAVCGAGRLIGTFTRFSGELFGALIAVLFLQQAVKGLIANFREDPATDPDPEGGNTQPGTDEATPESYPWRLVNGLWGVVLAFGLLLSALLVATARRWRFLLPSVRGLLADYGAPAMVLVWTGVSFALAGAPSGVPRRVRTDDTWATDAAAWSVAQRMGEVPPGFIAAALVPALVIAVLFFFDHNVSSQMAQQPEYNLSRPAAYDYDMALLAGMTLMCGLVGLPPVNGVLPQAPMHTRSLATLKQQLLLQRVKSSRFRGSISSSPSSPRDSNGGSLQYAAAAGAAASDSCYAIGPARAACGSASGGSYAAAAGPVPAVAPEMQHYEPYLAPAEEDEYGNVHAAASVANGAAAHIVHGISAAEAACNHSGRRTSAVAGQGRPTTAGPAAASEVSDADARLLLRAATTEAAGSGGTPQALPMLSGQEQASVLAPAPALGAECGGLLPLQVLEQRLSNLLQSAGVAACLFATPAIQQIPQAVLWGYFAFMAIESLPGSQIWDRCLLLVTDPARRARMLRSVHAPYLETVPMRTVASFTLLQVACLAGLWALVTWAGIGGIAFPIPIMALVPVRMYLLPRFFAASHLRELDAAQYEEAPPVPATELQLLAAASATGALPAPPERDLIEAEHVGGQPVHHLSRGELRRRAADVAVASPAPLGLHQQQ